MEERFGSPSHTDVYLEPALPHLVHQLEKADEIGLPGPVRPDEDVERAEFDHRVPDRFPPRESQAGQLCHFTSSLFRCHRPSEVWKGSCQLFFSRLTTGVTIPPHTGRAGRCACRLPQSAERGVRGKVEATL